MRRGAKESPAPAVLWYNVALQEVVWGRTLETSAFPEKISQDGEGSGPRHDAIGHAWNWFKYHAEQRMILVRFYLIMAGALGAGYISVLKDNENALATVIAGFGAFVSLLFFKLDQRTARLIKLGERALAKREEVLAGSVSCDELKIVDRAEEGTEKWLGSTREIFASMFVAALVVFCLAGLIALLKTTLAMRLAACVGG